MTPVLLGLAAAAGNLAGAIAVVRGARRSLGLIELALAFGAGFMLALVLVGVLPEVFTATPASMPVSGLLVMLGYALVHLAQHVIPPHFHFGLETHSVGRLAGYSALIGLSMHAFFDGVAIASGFLVSPGLGQLFFLAVMLHKLPEGVTISSLMLASGQSRGRAIGGGAVLGGVTVLGVLLTDAVAPLARFGLALSAGVTLYVAASNLVPEIQASRRWRTTVAFLGGMLALLLLSRLETGPP